MEGYFGGLSHLSKKHPIRNKVFTLLEFACIPLVLWWIPYSHLPAPGWAVAFIAGAAAAMSVHDDMKGWQKGLWMLIIGAFLITELRAISKDRAEIQHQAIVDRQAQYSAFAVVLQKQNEQFAATGRGFSSTYTRVDGVLKTTQQVAELSKENLSNITGGNSYLYFEPILPPLVGLPQLPKNWIEVNAFPKLVGEFPLHGVIVMVSCPNGRLPETVNLETVYPLRIGRPTQGLNLQFPASQSDRVMSCLLEITTSNGSFSQNVHFLKSANRWTWNSTIRKYGQKTFNHKFFGSASRGNSE
jgi:hypothetical protein